MDTGGGGGGWTWGGRGSSAGERAYVSGDSDSGNDCELCRGLVKRRCADRDWPKRAQETFDSPAWAHSIKKGGGVWIWVWVEALCQATPRGVWGPQGLEVTPPPPPPWG